ncbi:MAG: HAD hydrolase-like protein [Nitriliruptoraceae bacterium]
MRPHIVWDWNGTLFDDLPMVIVGLNVALAAAGLPPIDQATYQRLYTRPVQVFYERLFGRPIEPDEWQVIDEAYHTGYREAIVDAQLAADATDALARAADAGASQSLLSMYRHDDLLPLVDRFALTGHFIRVDGLRGPGGGVKAPHLEAHLERVAAANGGTPAEVLLIGDAKDDAAAAAHVGAACVLYHGGSHPRHELEDTGFPVADSLTEAVALASWA